MAFGLFFSYRRSDFGDPMREFFKDLGAEVCKLFGLDQKQDFAFFDQEKIETGDNWDRALLTALQQAQILIPMYSPAYFKSEYCGKEWQLFQIRRSEYANANGTPLPPVIKPVIWIPIRGNNKKLALPETLPDDVRLVQYTWQEEESEINQEGLEYIVRLKSNYATLYTKFLRRFAEKIKETIDDCFLPPLTSPPPLKEIPSAFAERSPHPLAQLPTRRLGARRHVRFIFAALNPESLDLDRNAEPYYDNGGSDWKPFYPDLKHRIGPLVTHIVSDPDLDFDCDKIEFTQDLSKSVSQAFDDGMAVVIFLDRWSLYKNTSYQTIFEEFDSLNFRNCAVILPWNPNDPELVEKGQEMNQLIARVLHFRSDFSQSSPYCCKTVESMDDLHRILGQVLNQIQSEMRRILPVRRKVGTTIAKPSVIGPGG